VEMTYTIKDTRETVKAWKQQGLTIGLVPTMGFLHEGHESLIQQAKRETDRVVVSIFVNPTQFAPNEDLDSYPRDMERDAEICRKLGVSLIFHPDVEEMYPADFFTFVDIHILSENLCGRSRLAHFRGVCTVVNKLFQIIAPDKAYFGEKDAQQLAIIKQMVKDLNMDLEIIGCPIIREQDGLAKSSRNAYLNEQERQAAVILRQSLLLSQSMLHEGERDVKVILEAMTSKIGTQPLAKIDYIHIVDLVTLQDVDRIERPVLIALAVLIGKIRLIDNIMYSEISI